MGMFDGVPGLDEYNRRSQANREQSMGEVMKLSQLMNLQKMQQDMQQAPEDRAMKQRLNNAQISNYEGQAADHQAKAQKVLQAFTMAQGIAKLPDGPEKQKAIADYQMFVAPETAFKPKKPLIEHNFSVGNDRVQPHISLDEGVTWNPIPGSQSAAKFAKQVPSIVNMGDAAGKIPMGYRKTADGNLEAIPGGPSDAKTQALAAQKANGATDVDLAVSTLRDAYDRLDKGGGITNTKNSGVGNVLPSLSSSGVGQAAGKLFGTANQSARNDVAMTRPALLVALMKATGMSAKQMDSNAELKLWLATATDPTLDVGSNRRALNNIEKKYLGGATPQAPDSAKPTGNTKPSMSEWMGKARAANPSTSGAELEAYYYKKYGK